MVKIVVAPDSLKGSLSATDAAAAIGDGIRRELPECNVVRIPVSDGGEGFLDAFASVEQAQTITRDVCGPDEQTVTATYRLAGDVAVIELAEAAGLHLTQRRDITTATTFGVGELILDALRLGAREILVGLGGSATVDGGIGMLRALGAHFVDGAGQAITKPADLNALDSVSLPQWRELASHDVRLQVAVDVEQTLAGCARTFGPQKGATTADVEVMERALARLAAVADAETHHADKAGSGAAGGVGFALSLLGAELRPGIDLVLDAIDFDAALVGATLCVTAEGRVDAQSLQGKATFGVARRAAAAGIRCVAIAGSVGDDLDTVSLPFEVARLHEEPAPSLEHARGTVVDDLRRAGARLAKGVVANTR